VSAPAGAATSSSAKATTAAGQDSVVGDINGGRVPEDRPEEEAVEDGGMDPAGVRVVAVEAAAVRPLRQAVLRPHQRLEQQVYPGDALPGAAHFAAYEAGEGGPVLGTASIAPEPYPRGERDGDWRIRGMATEPAQRGRGIGALLLSACLEHARAAGARRVWCNARSGVRGFYEREGFAVDGDEFELPEIGPHFLMSLAL
jgi:GNAT superfamily N-acetyltransferase